MPTTRFRFPVEVSPRRRPAAVVFARRDHATTVVEREAAEMMDEARGLCVSSSLPTTMAAPPVLTTDGEFDARAVDYDYDTESFPEAVDEEGEDVDTEDDDEDASPSSTKAMRSDDEDEVEDDYDDDEEEEELFDWAGSEDESGAEEDDELTAKLVPEGQFHGPAQYASVGSTAGFMRVAAATEADIAGGQELEVFYRYTRFSRACAGHTGVEASRWKKLHRLRFIVPAAGAPASSLPWAGSSLARLIYPVAFSEDLHKLWSSLAATASIPPRATRVQLFADVGILRRGDNTPELMDSMRGELEARKEEAWPDYYIGMELHLPEPVQCKRDSAMLAPEECHDDDDHGAPPPAKRRRVVVAAGEECPVCFDDLDTGLAAAWPGCSLPHVFHGGCLEQILKDSDKCPICRRDLGAKTLQ